MMSGARRAGMRGENTIYRGGYGTETDTYILETAIEKFLKEPIGCTYVNLYTVQIKCKV